MRVIKDSTKETLEGRGTRGLPHLNPRRMWWNGDWWGKVISYAKLHNHKILHRFWVPMDLICYKSSPSEENSPSTFLSPKERPKVTPRTQEKVLIKAYKTRKQRRISHVKTLMRSFNGTAPNGEATNQGTRLNVTPQIIVFLDTNECGTSS